MTLTAKDFIEINEANEMMPVQGRNIEIRNRLNSTEPFDKIGNEKSRTMLVSCYAFQDSKYPEDYHFAEDSKFDIHLFSFLKPFQLVRSNNISDQNTNKTTTKGKYHIDLSSYFTKSFSVFDLQADQSLLQLFMQQLLNSILAYPRQYVIFVGDFFKDFLADYIQESDKFSFNLTSSNKINHKITATFTRITIKYNGKRIIAGIAESFFDDNLDGIMLEKYGLEAVYLINRGFLLSNPLWSTQLNSNKQEL